MGSDVFRFHTERNRLLVAARNAPLRLVALTLLAETRHCVRVNLALLVKASIFPAVTGVVDPIGDGMFFVALLYGGAALPLAMIPLMRGRRAARPG